MPRSTAVHNDETLTRQSIPDVNVLKELARKDLVDALNSVSGAKTLVIDSSLAGPLGLVTEVSLLKQHGVDKMFWLEPGALTSPTKNIIYLCRPSIKHIKIIADQIKRHTRELQKHLYTLLLVPRTSTLARRILEEEGVLGEVTITTYNLQFIPIAEDVVSLEAENAFKEIWVDGDETVIYDSAQALLRLQKVFGPFPRIVGKGDKASRLANLMTRHAPSSTAASKQEAPMSSNSKFDCLILLDRRVDMITPLLTQLTYEGLIDEVIGIKHSHVELPISLISPPAAPAPSAGPSTSASTPAQAPRAPTLTREKKKKHHLTTATDPLFAQLRDLNFSSVGKKLNKVAHRLDEDYKARLQAKTVTQLRDFVGKLGGLQTEHQSLRLHTGLSELLLPATQTEQFGKALEIQQNLLASYEISEQISAIEDMIAEGAEMQVVLRLLCLATITAGGIKAKVLEHLKREILQAYGYNLLPLLLSLAAPPLCILLPSPLPSSTPPPVIAASKYPYTSLRKSFRLLVEDTPDSHEDLENDIGFVYSGYAPISIRLVQCVAQKGGVLSNPTGAGKAAADERDGDASALASSQVRAHPIIGWKGFDDVVATIPGETIDIVQKNPASKEMSASAGTLFHSQEHYATTTVVFFLGGCTYTEIAALRWVARQNQGRHFLVATTSIISGAGVMESIAGIRGSTAGEAGI